MKLLGRIFSSLILVLLFVSGCATLSTQHITIPNSDFPFSFNKEPYLNPRIIQDLSTWISDTGDQVVAINVLRSQDSNRYFGDVQVNPIKGKNPYIYFETSTLENGETNKTSFGYQLVGVTDGGLYVLQTSNCGGGSGVFKNLMVVSFEYDGAMDLNFETGEVQNKVKRLLIKKRGEVALGDRWDGELKVTGDSIFVGQDKGWFSVSGGTGGNQTQARVLRVGR